MNNNVMDRPQAVWPMDWAMPVAPIEEPIAQPLAPGVAGPGFLMAAFAVLFGCLLFVLSLGVVIALLGN
jgi:hypothetical protein